MDFEVADNQKGYSNDVTFTNSEGSWKDSIPAGNSAWVIAKGNVSTTTPTQSTTGNITSAEVQDAFGTNTLVLGDLYNDASVAITASNAGQESYQISNATFQYEAAKDFDVTSKNSVALDASTTITSGTLNASSLSGEVTLKNTSSAVSVAAGGLGTAGVNTNIGKITITETGDSTATKVDYKGTITGLDAGGTFTLAKGDSDSTDEVTVSVNGKEFTFVNNEDASMTYGDGKYTLTAGSERLVRGEKYYVSVGSGVATAEYNGGGSGKNKGVIVNTAGDYVSDINKGEAVTITGGSSSTPNVVSANSNGVLMVSGGSLPAFFKIDSEGTAAVSISGSGIVPTGVDTDASIAGAAFGWSLKGSTAGSIAASIVDGVYLDSEGKASNEKPSKLAGVFGVTSDAVTFDASSSSKGQVISAYGGGTSLTGGRQWNILGSTGDDEVSVNAAADGDAISTVRAGAGNDSITASGDTRFILDGGDGNDAITSAATGDHYITGGAGKDTISVTAAGGGVTIDAGADNDNVVLAGAGGDYKVSLGAGNDTISASGTGTFEIFGVGGNNKIDATGISSDEATIRGGSGNDTISADKDVVVYGGEGNDYFDISSKDIKVKDFTFNNDYVMVVGTGVSANNISVDSSEGKISYSGKTADLGSGTGTGSYYAVKLVDSTGKNEQVVAWAGAKGGMMDTTGYQDKGIIVFTNGNDDVSDTVISGVKNDTIYAGTKDAVYAGAGDDFVSIASGSEKVTVAVTSSMGKDTVSGFVDGFGTESSEIYMLDGEAKDISFKADGTNVYVALNTGKVTLSGITGNSSTGAAELKVNGYKAAVATSTGGIINVSEADYADYYYGDSSTLNFANVTDDVTVDLRDSEKFRGINQIVGGQGKNVFYGTSKADTLTAGAGETSVIAGAGNDVIELNNASNVGHSVGFNIGDGKDTVSGFVAATPDNYNTSADTVYFMTAKSFKSGSVDSNGNVNIELTDESKLVLSGVGGDTAVRYTENGSDYGYAKFQSSGNSFTYTAGVGNYYGAGNNTLYLDSTAGDANIWLDGSKGIGYTGITAVDASSATGTYQLAGTTGNETLIGGSGTNEIWGKKGNDVMIGNGDTKFYYELGDGNDKIMSTNSNDLVELMNITTNDLKAEVMGSTIEFTFADQGKLSVDSTIRNFRLAKTGEEYFLNDNNEWQKKGEE